MTEKKATMTNRERIEAMLRGEKPDRVPIWPIALGFCTVYIGGHLSDSYTNPDLYMEGYYKACEDFDWVNFPMIASVTTFASEFGGEIKWPDGEFAQAPMITRFAVETAEDVMNLEIPDIKSVGTTPMRMEYSKKAATKRLDNQPFNVMSWMGGPITSAFNIPGVEKACRWMIKEPEAVHRLMRITIDCYKELAQYWKDTFGLEGVLPFFGEPSASNQIISPKQFEKFALPYIKELCEALLNIGHKHIFVHICGEQNLNLPHWAKIPFGSPGIVSFGHEVALEKAASFFPKEIIMGNLEPAIIQTGTPEEVYAATRNIVEKGKEISGGFIFSAGCELPPKSPVENVKMITKAVNDFGWY
jgi:uroporphyrinogen decarboxylase